MEKRSCEGSKRAGQGKGEMPQKLRRRECNDGNRSALLNVLMSQYLPGSGIRSWGTRAGARGLVCGEAWNDDIQPCHPTKKKRRRRKKDSRVTHSVALWTVCLSWWFPALSLALESRLSCLEDIHGQGRSCNVETNSIVIVDPSGLSAVLHPQRHDPHRTVKLSRRADPPDGQRSSRPSTMTTPGDEKVCADKLDVRPLL